MKSIVLQTGRVLGGISGAFNTVQPLLTLAGRIYVSWVFFASGLTKIADWETTLFLFEYEYHVPFLPVVLAAYLATLAELIVPVLLTSGLASRLSAIVLSIVNVVAVISLEEIAPAALYGHVIWGLILAHVVFWGAGQLSADHVIKWLYNKRLPQAATAQGNGNEQSGSQCRAPATQCTACSVEQRCILRAPALLTIRTNSAQH